MSSVEVDTKRDASILSIASKTDKGPLGTRPTGSGSNAGTGSLAGNNKIMMYVAIASIVVLVVITIVLGVLLHNKQKQNSFLEQKLYGQTLTPERRNEIYHEHIQLQR